MLVALSLALLPMAIGCAEDFPAARLTEAERKMWDAESYSIPR